MNTNHVIIIKELMKIESRLDNLNKNYQAQVDNVLNVVRSEITKRKGAVK